MQGTEGRFHKLGCGNANDLAGRRALLDQLYNFFFFSLHNFLEMRRTKQQSTRSKREA